MLMLPEALAQNSLEPVARHGGAYGARRDREAKAWMGKRVGVHGGSEIGMVNAAALGVDKLELRWAVQAPGSLKAQTARRNHALGNQPLAPFCAAARQHLAAVFGRHACAKPVGACAAYFARLICAFHDSKP